MPVVEVKVFGDYGKLDRWIARFGSLGSPSRMLEVSRALGKKSLELIEEGFEQERDPFGNPWAPKKEPDGNKILQGKNGRLKQWKLTYANSEGFKVASRAPYAGVHQSGSGTYAGRGRYLITPKHGKYLRFRVGGVAVYAASVMHPGVPRRRMEPGNRLPSKWFYEFRDIYLEKMRNYLRT